MPSFNSVHSSDVVIVGASLAAIVCAQELLKSGYTVTLVAKEGTWGGHFAGRAVCNSHFPLGMVLLEFSSFNNMPDPDWKSYSPHVRNDVGRFAGAVREYLERHGFSFFEVPKPQMVYADTVYPDILIGDSLEALRMLPADICSILKTQIAGLTSNTSNPMHPSQKCIDPKFLSTSYASVSRLNHGSYLHDNFFDCFYKKLTGQLTTNVGALFHRAAWLPLYYPETIESYLNDSHFNRLKPAQFFLPLDGNVSGIVENLLCTVRKFPHYAEVIGGIQELKCSDDFVDIVAANVSLRGRQLVWSPDLGALLRLTGLTTESALERTSIGFAFIELNADALKRDVSVLNVIDEEHLLYRLTKLMGDPKFQTTCRKIRFVAEFSPSYAETLGIHPDQYRSEILKSLLRLNIVESESSVSQLEIHLAHSGLCLPTISNYQAFQSMLMTAETLSPRICRIASAQSLFNSSFNDHIVQGINAARTASASIV